MRIAMMFFGAIAGMAIGHMLGEPYPYDHGQPEERIRQAAWAFGGGCVGTLIPFFYPGKRRK